MFGILRATVLLIFFFAMPSFAQTDVEQKAEIEVDTLQTPLYNPFVERYVLDELKQLRIDTAKNKHELMQQILDREHTSIDRAVTYATDTITYFFYLIAAATSVLVLIGWTSIRDIKERVHILADEQISKLVSEYEMRLATIESQLQQKTRHIEQNRDEIGLTQEIQSLWLRSQQDAAPASKITIYDEILKLRGNDCEALTYKADAVLELGEPQWAANLCLQALKIDPENSQAFYQLACAYTALRKFDKAVHYLAEALSRQESYRDEIEHDPALHALVDNEVFKTFINATSVDTTAPHA
ncbi:MAG: tetratricopeptide (TPR) repeat protein [Lentisphaeria bacterium]|jgi:tetratricopeptide (TPR) repeat protein